MIEGTQDKSTVPNSSGANSENSSGSQDLRPDEANRHSRPSLRDHMNLAGETLSGAGKSLRDGVVQGTKLIGELGTALHLFYTSTGSQISKQIQGARNFAAEVTSTGGNILGLGGGIAGEISLIGAGGIPFLVFGGLPLELGVEFGNLCDSLSQNVRGSSPQFIGLKKVPAGIFKSEDAEAILYLPKAADADSCGFITRKEIALAKDLVALQNSAPNAPETAVRYAAVVALQDYKKQLGLTLDTPDLHEAITT